MSDYYRLVDAGDSEFLEVFHPDATYKRPGYELFSGREQLAVFYASTRVIVRGSHRLVSVFASGTRVAVEGVFKGVLRNDSAVTVPFSDFFLFDRCDAPPRVLERRTYFDDVAV